MEIKWYKVTSETICVSFVGNSVCTTIHRPNQPNPANQKVTRCVTTKK